MKTETLDINKQELNFATYWQAQLRRNQVIYAVDLNDPQTQNFVLEVIPIIQLQALEKKAAIDKVIKN